MGDGIELSLSFFEEIVRPILDASFPGLPYAAALIGTDSEVLGFDDELSRDHDFGSRMFLILRSDDTALRVAVHDVLDRELPLTFRGFDVDLPESSLSGRFGCDGRPRSHRVIPVVLADFLSSHFGPSACDPWDVIDWLTVSSQSLRECTAGAVFHDGPRELTQWRTRLAWYPHDVWLYLMAAGWQRIGQEEHLWQRAGSRGDEPGAGVLGARLVRDVMRQCFLIERVYAPYAKWLGTAFRQLDCAAEMEPLLGESLFGPTWEARSVALLRAFEELAQMQNGLGLCEPMPAHLSPFFDRPFAVIHGDRFVQALVASISDPDVRALATRGLIGNVDQWSDNTDIFAIERPRRRGLYE